MTQARLRTEVTSADSKSLGFDYQYLFFISQCLSMTTDDSVGYEDIDDVHIVTTSGAIHHFQVKYTSATDATGLTQSLTNLSNDLWKSFSNWCKVICDKMAGRSSRQEQLSYSKLAFFYYVTNRPIDSTIVKAMIAFKSGRISKTDLLTSLKALQKETKSSDISCYINEVLELPSSVFSMFFSHLFFITSPDDLYAELRRKISEKMVPKEYVDSVLSELYSQLKEEYFSIVKQKKHQVITYNEWYTRYMGCFTRFRNTSLPLREVNIILPPDLESQYFVRELLDIGVLECGDNLLISIAEYTTNYLRIYMLLKEWLTEGRITLSDIVAFDRDAKTLWHNIHQRVHRTSLGDPNIDIQNALKCFDDVMLNRLILLSNNLDMELSNGEFIKLAEDRKIGWLRKWKEYYYASADK